MSASLLHVFETGASLGSIARPRIGQNTGDNNRFLRFWQEVDAGSITYGLSHNELTTKNINGCLIIKAANIGAGLEIRSTL